MSATGNPGGEPHASHCTRFACHGFVARCGPGRSGGRPAGQGAGAVVAVVQSWTGFYFGAHGGYAWGRNSVGYSANDPASDALFAAFAPLGTAGLNASNR